MTASLKPCPFCGVTKIDGGYNDYGGFVSICANCNASGPPASEMSREAIIAAWNTRADAPELVALVDALREVAVRPTLYTDGGELDWLIDDAKSALAAWEAMK